MQSLNRAAIYVRISNDPAGTGLGVQRQEADARALCQRRGWEVAEVFSDNDLSAWSGKPRPRYQDMLEAVRRGEVHVIVAWHPDRLHRQTRELAPFIDLVNQHGVQVETVTAGAYDLSTPSGRMQARIVGSVAEYESEHKAERIRRKLEANAASGKHHGGSRPFGWLPDRVTLDEAEAAVVREAALKLLAGESCKGVARALNAEGHRTARGQEWRDVTVRTMLLRDRNAGLRVHHGEVVGEGLWEPILDEATHLQVKAVLSDPSRRTTPGRDGEVHLLSALARCGVCDGPVIVAREKTYKGVQGHRIYRCRKGHVSREKAAVDDLVTRLVLGRLAMPDARELLAAPDSSDDAALAAAEVQELSERLREAAEAYAAGVLTLAQLTTVNAKVKPRLEAAEARAASPGRSRVLGELVGRDPETVWQGMTPEARRAVVALLVDVTILPARRGHGGFDPDTVKIEWRRGVSSRDA